MLLDLDNFKLVNDSLGHDVVTSSWSDRAEALADDAGSDTIARLGGDEFGFVVESFHSDIDLIGLAKRILAAFEDPFVIGGGTQASPPASASRSG